MTVGDQRDNNDNRGNELMTPSVTSDKLTRYTLHVHKQFFAETKAEIKHHKPPDTDSTIIISQANQAPMPAAFFTPVTHFHYSYFFTNFGIFRVKIWREWTYILVTNGNWYCFYMTPWLTLPMQTNIFIFLKSKHFKTHQNCQSRSDVSVWLILHIVHNTPVVLMLSKRGCLSFEFMSKLAKYVSDRARVFYEFNIRLVKYYTLSCRILTIQNWLKIPGKMFSLFSVFDIKILRFIFCENKYL